METCLQSQATLLPLLYLLATTAYGVAFFHEQDVGISRRLATPLLATSLLFHAVYLVMMTVIHRRPPLTTVWEFLATLSFGIAGSYLLIERRTGTKSTGIVVLPLATLLLAVSSAFISHSGGEVAEVLRSPWFGAHAGTMVLGFAAFALSATFGVLWFMLYRNIKASRFGLIYDRLPPLAVLFRMVVLALVLGWVSLTVSILVGGIWSASALEGFHRDPKFLVTVAVWVFYGLGLAVRYVWGRHGTWLAYVAVSGFVLLLGGAFAAAALFPSQHAFH